MTDETDTPKVRLKAEVAALIHEHPTDPAPARHETSEPVNVVDALAQMMSEHEKGEQKIAAELREHVDEVEGRAATERAALSTKLDELTSTVKTGLHEVKEVAESTASIFLARDDERRQQIEGLRAEVGDLRNRMVVVEQQIRNLNGVGT